MNVSKVSKSGLACTQAGTPYYSSPEVWGDLPYTAKCDIWSLGCVLYEMAAMRPPFLAVDLPGLRKKIESGICDRIPEMYSQDLDAFVRLCMAPSAKDRPSAEGLLHNNLIRKQLYRFPNEKFNESCFDLSDKENRLL
jgi:NIMA (never in mitosis gene a)-related kinase 1/4/5